MTNTEVLAAVYSHFGSEDEIGVVEPAILNMIEPALLDTARYVIATDKQLARQLATGPSSLTVSGGMADAPNTMLFQDQKSIISIVWNGGAAFQVFDVNKLPLAGTTNTTLYYGLRGKKIHFSQAAPTNVSITYLSAPALATLPGELESIFLDMMFKRVAMAAKANPQQISTGQEMA